MLAGIAVSSGLTLGLILVTLGVHPLLTAGLLCGCFALGFLLHEVLSLPLALLFGILVVGWLPQRAALVAAVSQAAALVSGWLLRRWDTRRRLLLDKLDQISEAHQTEVEENQRVNAEFDRSMFEWLALLEFTRTLSSVLRLDELTQTIVDAVKQMIGCDACFLALSNGQATSPLNCVSGTSEPGESIWKALCEVAQSGSPRMLNLPDAEAGHSIQAVMVVPLIAGNKPQGALCAGACDEDHFSKNDLRLLYIIANQAALAIQNARLYEEVARAAVTDGLTGLYNHAYFRAELAIQLEKARLAGKPVSLLLVDIDLFKLCNDRFGHLIGDTALKSVASVLRRAAPAEAIVARYGGEEFAIILPATPCSEAVDAARRLCESVRSEPVAVTPEGPLHVSVSIGVASYPDHTGSAGETLTALIAATDEQLLQRAKKNGRNQVAWPEGF